MLHPRWGQELPQPPDEGLMTAPKGNQNAEAAIGCNQV